MRHIKKETIIKYLASQNENENKDKILESVKYYLSFFELAFFILIYPQ